MKNYKITVKGKDYWISRSIAVHAIILLGTLEEPDRYLLITRRGPGCPDERGKLADVTGYIDWGETLLEGLKREVGEEIGLDLDSLEKCDIKFQGIYDLPVGKQNVTIRYEVRLDKNEVLPLIKNGIININTESRGGEKDEVSEIILLDTYECGKLNPSEFAFNHGEVLNNYVK